MSSTLYFIPKVSEQERDQLLILLIEFAFDADYIRAAHFGNHLFVDVAGGLGPNVMALGRKIRKGIYFAAESFSNIPFMIIHECGGEQD